jgi:signal transduction histidine kinase
MTEWLRPDRHVPRELRWVAADVALAGLFVWITIASLRSDAYVDEFGSVEGMGWVLAIAPTLLLPARRVAPATTLAAATVLYMAASASQGDSNAPLAIPFFTYAVGLTRPVDVSAWMVGASAMAMSTTVFYGPGEPDALAVVVWSMLCGIGWVVAVSIRRSQARAAELEHAAEAIRAEQVRIAEQAVADERARIARELHDAVGHAVNVIVLQAGAARISGRHDRAMESLREIENLGRDALTDLDHMLGLLHHDGPAPLGPGRSTSDIAQLVTDTRAAGADVRLHDECDCEVDPVTGSAAYRIVQEALTNAIKHARGAQVDVTLRCDANDFVVLVVNAETRSPHSSRRGRARDEIGGGRGVPGMTERAKVLGGRMSVGPDDDGRFVVDARLPRTRRRRPQAPRDEAAHGA